MSSPFSGRAPGALAGAEGRDLNLDALTKNKAMAVCADESFVPSVSVNKIKQYLSP